MICAFGIDIGVRVLVVVYRAMGEFDSVFWDTQLKIGAVCAFRHDAGSCR
jgi:hypothetical protein